MNRVVIPKSKIYPLLDMIKKENRVIAPVKEEGILEFREIQSSAEVCITDEICYKSPKEFYFPQTEKILHFDTNGEVREEVSAVKTVIFGIRPCDAEALKILTTVFTKGKFTDNIFVDHLKNTIIIGMGCIKEKPGCFCSERGIQKDSSGECDIFILDKGNYFLGDIITEKGEKIIANFIPEAIIAEEPVEIPSEHSTANNILELDIEENLLFNDADWEKISEMCIGCGACTYICPTCHCFEFKDISKNGEVSRYRCWDSCMYPKFTLHTSGHNPRPSKKERFRQRIMHKYLYIRKNFGYTACTGCGRCIRSCPAGMNIKTVVKSIMEELM